jgi:hypothetical protein
MKYVVFGTITVYQTLEANKVNEGMDRGGGGWQTREMRSENLSGNLAGADDGNGHLAAWRTRTLSTGWMPLGLSEFSIS